MTMGKELIHGISFLTLSTDIATEGANNESNTK
jgi:hypothetical protein